MPVCPRCGRMCRSEGGLTNHLKTCDPTMNELRGWDQTKEKRKNQKWW